MPNQNKYLEDTKGLLVRRFTNGWDCGVCVCDPNLCHPRNVQQNRYHRGNTITTLCSTYDKGFKFLKEDFSFVGLADLYIVSHKI